MVEKSMPGNDDYSFFVQLYEDVEGVATYTGIIFESGVLGEEVPRSGDCIISPLRKADFDPRNPGNHFAFDIQRRYFLPGRNAGASEHYQVARKTTRLNGGRTAAFQSSLKTA
jgi:hypothetical protein